MGGNREIGCTKKEKRFWGYARCKKEEDFK